jgi:spore maturation protein CgeD
MPAASVFTLSHNKGASAADAIASVLRQDFTDFEYWILENSTDSVTRETIAPLLGDPRIRYEEITLDPAERAVCYVPAVLLNRYYPKANGKYIFYLSDDDLLNPGCVRRCTEFLDADPSRQVCYFSHHHQTWYAGAFMDHGSIMTAGALGAGTGNPVVDCRIDGGQIVHTRECLDFLDQPWFPEEPDPVLACHADGRFMQRLADRFTFWPLPEVLGTKRRTELSLWDRAS